MPTVGLVTFGYNRDGKNVIERLAAIRRETVSLAGVAFQKSHHPGS